MTDREAAAGLVESMPGVCDALDRMGMHILAGFCEDIGPTITTLLSELERVGKENDKLRDFHRRASEETGELLGRALKAEKERDEMGRMMAPDAVARLTEALLTVQNAAFDLSQRLTVETARANAAKAELARLKERRS